MEPISTSLIVAVLVPLLSKGADKLIEKTVEAGFDERRRIWEIVKGIFAEDDLTILNFESTPDDPRIQGKLEAKLEDRLEDRPELVGELEALLSKLSLASDKDNVVIQSGNKNIANQDISNSTISIKN